jgi:hypothetical protein
MSDKWLFYPCQMGEYRGSIFFDHGIRKTIDQIAPPQLLKVRAALKSPGPDGLSSKDEFQPLCALEDGLQALADTHGGIYVGRVTAAGHRYFHLFTSDTRASWSARLTDLSQQHGYPLRFVVKPDERRDGYWLNLFPSGDDWQVISDIRILEALKQEGDNGTASRRVGHWAYFPSPGSAEQFSQWAQGRGYSLDDVCATDSGKFRVRFFHSGRCLLSDITSHTVALRRKANQLGGQYDGWETPVCKA